MLCFYLSQDLFVHTEALKFLLRNRVFHHHKIFLFIKIYAWYIFILFAERDSPQKYIQQKKLTLSSTWEFTLLGKTLIYIHCCENIILTGVKPSFTYSCKKQNLHTGLQNALNHFLYALLCKTTHSFFCYSSPSSHLLLRNNIKHIKKNYNVPMPILKGPHQTKYTKLIKKTISDVYPSQ